MPPVTGDNNRISQQDRRKYDRLRTLARNAADKRGDCYKRAREAHGRHNGALASQLSKEAKIHGKQMNKYNKRAWKFIFKLNNTGRPLTTIDLHDLFVAEALACLLKRMNEVKASREERICVIVGRGLHAADGQPKIKPAVEKLCQERGLTFTYQRIGNMENPGMIIILLEDYAVENIKDANDTGDSDVGLRDASDSEEGDTIVAPSSSRPAVETRPQAPPSPLFSAPPAYAPRPVASQPYTRPPIASQPTNPPIANSSYTRPPIASNSYTRPPIASQPTSPPITNSSYTRPPIASNSYTRPPIASQPTSPPIANNSYTRPPIASNSYIRPPITSNSYTRPPITNYSYTPSPITNHSFTSPPIPHQSRTTTTRTQSNYRSIDAEERGVPSKPEGDSDCGWFGKVILVATIIGLGIFFFV